MPGDCSAHFIGKNRVMEYVVFIVFAVAFVLLVFVQGIYGERNELNFYKRKLREQVGEVPDKKYKIERFLRISGYYEKHTADFQIDDITWNDLGMDEIFKRVDYAISSTGEEYLYYMLRTPQFEEEKLKAFDEAVEYYRANEEARVRYQCLMHKLGSTGKFSLYDYLDYLENLEKRSNIKDYVMLAFFVALLGSLWLDLTMGILGIILWMLYQIFSYFKVKKEIEPYITSLAYISRLIRIAEDAAGILPKECEGEKKNLLEAGKQLKKSQKGSYWLYSLSYNNTGNPFDVLLDYIRMIFHLDLISFNNMLREILLHRAEVDALITNMGYLEAAICIGLYRESLKNGWCKPYFTENAKLKVKEGYHPLIAQPVKNSIAAKGGVLLTGSNASGKSTFLKMMALSSLLAQTIYTVTANQYEAPFYYLYSSMSLRDDLESGESYYIVEIKSIKRILDERKKRKSRILCFVDEVLRGTNTVERIAASTQILLSMTGTDIQCFAATHDIELTQLLEDVYENYHFEEEIKDGDILFNYKLRPGKATTRNAIKLLEIMGYEPEIIQNAGKQAKQFLQKGVWNRP